jgi:hypothetical protein
MRYVTRFRAEQCKYGMHGVHAVRRPKAAQAALARQRGAPIRVIDSIDAKYLGIAICVAILTALLYFHLASDLGNLELATVQVHVASPAS